MALTDFVIMPGADYQALVDKIKEKTGKTDPLVSGQLAAELDNISGGTSEDVRYVTFMSYDGVTEYGKKAVAVGDDCADPIARGVFDTPTRESTAEYNYVFAGWATSAGGALNSGALKAVEKDRTVYANFAAVVRYYTIRFFDGETLLESKSVAYGAMPSIEDPEKSGYSFDCWNPEIVAVTGDADYYAQWTMNLKFANASWADIATVAESGNAANVFALGDTRTVPILFPKGNTYDVTFEIVGFNHDNLSDGSGKAGITVISKDIIPTYQTFGGYEYYFGVTAWPTNAIRTALNGDVFNGLPADLQPHIKTVSKISADASTTLHTTDDKVWIPSGTELGARAILSPLTQCVEGQGEHYPHFVAPSTVLTGRLQSANLNKTVHPSFTSSVATRYGTRSPSTAGTYYNIFVNAGVLKSKDNQVGDQFVFGFCI